MADPIPRERLQPCLLDRLTDNEPLKGEEGRSDRVVSLPTYRRGVLRDLEWLLNSTATLSTMEELDLKKRYPEVFRSVLNFGTKQLCGTTGVNARILEGEMTEVFRVFEPRIAARSLAIRVDKDLNLVNLDVVGDLWANPLPERLHLKTTLDLETGQVFKEERT